MIKQFIRLVFYILSLAISSEIFVGCDKNTLPLFENDRIPVAPKVPLNDPAIVPVACTDQWWIDKHNDKKNNSIQNQKIIFIGNSITQGWEETDVWNELNEKYDNRITNLGFGGDKTQNVIWRLENGEFPAGINPEYAVVMIGTNNGDKPESTAAGIGKILKIINTQSPLTKIILMSLLPRGNGINDNSTKRNNAVNDIIKNYNNYVNIQYVNLGQYYIDNNGQLRNELFSDKLHLTEEGYVIWKNKLIEIIGD